MSDEATRAAERFRTTLHLFEFGEAMQRQRLVREYPERTPDQIETRLVEWLQDHPGAEAGDAVGRPGRWPRNRSS